MNKLILFFNSLEKRERIVILIGIYSFVIIIGIFGILLPILDKKKEIEKRVDKEFENYYQLIKITEKYLSIKKSISPLNSLNEKFISNIARQNNIKNFSIEKLNVNRFKISFENINSNQFVKFLKALKENGITIESIEFDIGEKNIKKGSLILSLN